MSLHLTLRITCWESYITMELHFPLLHKHVLFPQLCVHCRTSWEPFIIRELKINVKQILLKAPEMPFVSSLRYTLQHIHESSSGLSGCTLGHSPDLSEAQSHMKWLGWPEIQSFLLSLVHKQLSNFLYNRVESERKGENKINYI